MTTFQWLGFVVGGLAVLGAAVDGWKVIRRG
jgi:hypothetical protein